MRKKKEEVEVRNNADSMVYNTEKALKELEGKVSDDEKAKVEAEIANVKKALEGTDTEAIKSANEKLTQVFYEISQKLYAEASKQAESTGEATEDVVHDADYKVEDESENK